MKSFLLGAMSVNFPMIAMAAADKPSGPAAGAKGAEKTAGSGGAKFTDAQIKEMRNMRAERHPKGHAKEGKPVYSHAKLAEKFGTNAGTVSHIVRNRTYKDPAYKPTNDGA